MARLPYLDKSDLLPEHQDLLARNLNLYRVLAHSPRAARSLNTLARYIRDGSRLDPRLRELAILQVSYLTRSAWGYSHHVRIGREVGLSDDDIRAVADETAGRPTGLEPLAKTVLRAARDARRRASVLGIEGTGWDIGYAVRFLLSTQARYITGHTLVVDGGATLVGPARATE